MCVLYGGVLNHTLLRIRNTQHMKCLIYFLNKLRYVYCIFVLISINTKYKIVSLFVNHDTRQLFLMSELDQQVISYYVDIQQQERKKSNRISPLKF